MFTFVHHTYLLKCRNVLQYNHKPKKYKVFTVFPKKQNQALLPNIRDVDDELKIQGRKWKGRAR